MSFHFRKKKNLLCIEIVYNFSFASPILCERNTKRYHLNSNQNKISHWKLDYEWTQLNYLTSTEKKRKGTRKWKIKYKFATFFGIKMTQWTFIIDHLVLRLLSFPFRCVCQPNTRVTSLQSSHRLQFETKYAEGEKEKLKVKPLVDSFVNNIYEYIIFSFATSPLHSASTTVSTIRIEWERKKKNGQFSICASLSPFRIDDLRDKCVQFACVRDWASWKGTEE